MARNAVAKVLRSVPPFVQRLHPRQRVAAHLLQPHHMRPDALRADGVAAVHWVIPELDAHGGFDRHAAMCLRLAITEAVGVDAGDILIDLRDLTVLDEDATALLRWARDACRAHALHLALLIDVRAPGDALAHALTRAGLD